MLTQRLKNEIRFNRLPDDMIIDLVIMLGSEFYLLLSVNKTVREFIIDNQMGKKYFFFIEKLIKHYHYSKLGLNHFLREMHEDPAEKLLRQSLAEKKEKESKQQQGAQEYKNAVVEVSALQKKQLDPEEAYNFHATYQLSKELRTYLYSCQFEHPALQYNVDERYFHGRDYIKDQRQLEAIFRLVRSGHQKSDAVECIRGLSSLQAEGISWGLSEDSVKKLTTMQLHYIVRNVEIKHLFHMTYTLLAHPEIDNEIDLKALHAIFDIDQAGIRTAYQQLSVMSIEQKQQKIDEAIRHNSARRRQREDQEHAGLFDEVVSSLINQGRAGFFSINAQRIPLMQAHSAPSQASVQSAPVARALPTVEAKEVKSSNNPAVSHIQGRGLVPQVATIRNVVPSYNLFQPVDVDDEPVTDYRQLRDDHEPDRDSCCFSCC